MGRTLKFVPPPPPPRRSRSAPLPASLQQTLERLAVARPSALKVITTLAHRYLTEATGTEPATGCTRWYLSAPPLLLFLGAGFPYL